MSSKPSSTIGFERRFNAALRSDGEDEFVAATAYVRTPRPPTLERVVALNRGPFVGSAAPLEPLTAADGATVLDVRPAHTFADGHVAGAINVPLGSSGFGTKAGFVFSLEERLAIHAETPDEAIRAAARLHAVGFLELDGYLSNPPASARLEPVTVGELEELLASEAVDVIDVRELNERDGGYIAGSRHVPYRLLRACSDDLDAGVPIVTICESGARAAIAASILAACGIEARPVLDGGIADWQERGHLTTAFRRCGR